MALEDQQAVIRFRKKQAQQPARTGPIDSKWLRELALECGADDVGFVAISREELQPQILKLTKLMPKVQTVISLVCRMNPGIGHHHINSIIIVTVCT